MLNIMKAYKCLALNYFKAKEQFSGDFFENQLRLTTQEFLEQGE
jgi:hypothetical protein